MRSADLSFTPHAGGPGRRPSTDAAIRQVDRGCLSYCFRIMPRSGVWRDLDREVLTQEPRPHSNRGSAGYAAPPIEQAKTMLGP